MDAAKVAVSWAVVIAASGAFYWVNKQRKNKNRRTAVSKSTTKAVEPRKETKAKKARKESGSDNDAKLKKKAAQSAKPEEKSYSTEVDVGAKDNDEVDNREFARQLQSLQSGTVLRSKTQTASRPKSVKQTKAQEKPAVEHSLDNATAPSSTGADADDDESPVNSPEMASTPMAPIASGDVSDMLESPATGPRVLNIVQSNTAAPAKKAKAAKPVEAKETKKQRQNRQKAEALKLAREEDEKARRVMMEKQRRTAREAEGRAAKDGTGFMASQAPSTSAWTAPAPAANGDKSAASSFELLDTYEPTETNGAPAKPEAEEIIYNPSEVAGQLAKQYNGLSEEEQIRMIQEDSEEWMDG